MSIPPTPPPIASVPLAYHTPENFGLGQNDCSTRLTVIGILYILIGCLAGCGAAMMPFALFMVNKIPQSSSQPMPPNMTMMIIGAFFIYSTVSALLVTLGIGSIRKRRWARPFIIITSMHALVIGIATTILTPIMIYLQMELASTMFPSGQTPNPIPMWIPLVISGIFILILGVGVPWLILYLFKDERVKATVEFYDPQPRWTDACPLRVLGLAVTMWVFAAFSLIGVANGRIVFFGILMPIDLSIVIMLAISSIMGMAGWWIYKMRKSGYLVGAGVMCFMTLSMIVSQLILDVQGFFKAMGVDKELVNIYTQHPTIGKLTMFGLPILMSVSVLVYLWQVWNAHRNEIN